ncbi:AraC-like DNA-binding protein [Pedobacter cryoconitis]|uniref:AraC-like DNA-binding protein n=1 Tax=Pedobacter cryoconitis TaxID=188932 RepID=A0A7W9DYZ6_9SPHI|nr:AraC family transcriptional regulator [Pedobacter cryoconitis]MBB5635035.1 AraC-like DNA-binding protein [Pedobacter cryoconitis]
MNMQGIQSCHLGPGISPEQIVPEHFFLYILQGTMLVYNGEKHYEIGPGDCCIARKNHLLRYNKQQQNGDFKKIVIVLDEHFLKTFLTKHPSVSGTAEQDDSIVTMKSNSLLDSFIQSLAPYYKGEAEIEETFADIKREELLLILLQKHPGLANVFFNFSAPEKIDIEEFMSRNFRFNISLERFAFLTGRSLSVFKRDFRMVFNETPGRWLTRKRLEEAYFLIHNQNQKPRDIYLDLGFEDLSHFSFAFKKQFGQSPTKLHSVV